MSIEAQRKKVITILDKLSESVSIPEMKNDIQILNNKFKNEIESEKVFESMESFASALLETDFDPRHSHGANSMTKEENTIASNASMLM